VAFDDFNADKIALYDDRKLETLRHNSGIICNRLKITSAAQNARAYLEYKKYITLLTSTSGSLSTVSRYRTAWPMCSLRLQSQC